MKKIVYIVLLLISTNGWTQSLDEYLTIAAENNPALKAKFKMYEASLEKVNQVGSLPNPTLDFGYFISPIETRVGPQQAKIGLMQMFPWMGTLNAKENVYVQIAKSKYELFEAQKELLFYRVQHVWYEMYELEQSIIIVEENLKILNSFEALAMQKFETGTKTGMVDVLRIQMEIAELVNKKLLLEDKLKVKKIAFNNLLNREPTEAVSLPKEQAVLTILMTKEILNDSIKNLNNELKSLNMQKEAFHSSELLAKKQGLPMIGIGLNYFMINERTDMTVTDNGKDAIMPMVSITIPIYRKKYKAQKKEATLKAESVGFQIENKQNQLNTQLEMNWVNYEDADRRIVLYNQQNIKAKQALQIIVSSYTNSGKDFEEILRIQRMMLNYDLQLIKATKDKNVAVVKIEAMY